MSMTPNSAIERTLREIVGRLVRKDYQGLELLTHATRLRAQEIEAGVRDYGRTLGASGFRVGSVKRWRDEEAA
jgi:hypothetical protein